MSESNDPPQPQTNTHPCATLRAYLDTLPPPTLEQIAAMRAKVMAGLGLRAQGAVGDAGGGLVRG